MHAALLFIVTGLRLPSIAFVLHGYCQTPDLLPTMLVIAARAGLGLGDLSFATFNSVLNLAIQMTTNIQGPIGPLSQQKNIRALMRLFQERCGVCRPIERAELSYARQLLLLHPHFDNGWLTSSHALFRFVPPHVYEQTLRQVNEQTLRQMRWKW